MTTYTWPDAYKPQDMELRLMPNTRIIRPMFGGAPQSIEFIGARWQAILTMPPDDYADRAGLEAWLNRIRGPAHRIALWHMVRPLPRGTRQTNTTTNATAAQFASTITAAATTGETLLAGDMIGIALENSTTHLAQVVADTTAAASSISITFSPPLKWSVANGAAVTVNKPTATFMLTEPPGFLYRPAIAEPLQIVLEEA